MSVVSLLGVNILNNPARFTDNYQFEITFECLEQLEKGEELPLSPARKAWLTTDKCPPADLEWKLTYVGSATS